jgi:tRNA G18 (ribose-2'-O)-methylase SpoU
MSGSETGVRQIAGPAAIDAALRAGALIELVLVRKDPEDPGVADVIQRSSAAGIRIRQVSASVLRRMSQVEPPAEILALTGRAPGASLEEVLLGPGAVWLLVGVAYPGNVGMAIRTAEVSGAHGVVVDADFDRNERKFALRVSVRADWYMPVFWKPAEHLLRRAAETGRRIIGIEDVGTSSPWQTDLTGRVLLMVGGEADGIPRPLLDRCDEVIRIPMAGFIPAYNLQAAVAAIATERLRQLGELS